MDTLTDPDMWYSIAGAPRIATDLVIIGNGGVDVGVRGYVIGCEKPTGAQQLRFFTLAPEWAGPFQHPELKYSTSTWSKDDFWVG